MSEQVSNLSALPSIEQMREEAVMKIVRVVANDHRMEEKRVQVNLVNDRLARTNIKVRAYRIDDERVRGYLPSKCWVRAKNDGSTTIELSYYTSASLPDRARPLGNTATYVFAVAVGSGTTVEYPVEWKTFIDHVECNGAIWYVFVCSEEEWNKTVFNEGNR